MRLSDPSGIEGLPLRLMIVTLLISLSLPVALGSLQGFQEQAQGRAGMRIVDEIASAASSIYASGEGNMRLVELDWPEGQHAQTLKIRLCGPIGSVLSSRLDIIVDGEMSNQVFLSDPVVHLISDGSERLEIGPDCERLKLSCLTENDDILVRVEVV